MIFKPSSLYKFFFTYICPRFYGGPSVPTNTTTTTNQNTIPKQLMPYAKNMLNKAESLTQEEYRPFSTNTSDYVAPFSPLQTQAQTSASNLQTPGQFASASQMADTSGAGQLGTTGQALGYGAQGAGFGQNAADVGAIGGLGYGAQSANLGMQAAGMAGQGYGAGAQYAQQATNPNAIGAYMSPYMQNVMQQQGRELNRNYDITGAQQQGQATQAGAFGGSREALMASENERNRNMALDKMQAEGLQNAYTAATANQQFGANLGLTGMQAGNQALQTGLQGIGQGITGVNTALQGYQGGMAGTQAGLSGVQGAQQGYTGAANTAVQLGTLGQQQLAAQTGVLNTQNTIGGQQQAQQQQAIDQAVLNYQNAQQYPYMQLGFMSNLVRGTPTGNTTQTQYMAQPSMGSQIGGMAATGLGAYAALNAEGGVIKDKGYKSGGIVGYKDRGYVEESMLSKLEDLDRPRLTRIIQKNESPEMTKLAKEVLTTKLASGGIVAFANGGMKGKEIKGLDIHELATDKDRDDFRKQFPQYNDLSDEQVTELMPKEATQKVSQVDNINSTADLVGTDIQNNAAAIAAIDEMESAEQKQKEGTRGIPSVSKNQAVPVPAPTEQVDTLDSLMATSRAGLKAAEEEANMPLEERIQKRRDLEEEFLGKDTATEAYRAELAKQKADAPDDLRQEMGMRLMEFGANWASTPGPPLVAGMKALKETLPSVMKDTKEHKAMMKDLDKSTYMLEHSIRLERMGQLDAASNEREKAWEKVWKWEKTLTDLAVEQYKLIKAEEISESSDASRIEVAKIAADAKGSSNSSVALGPKIVSNDKALVETYKQLRMYEYSPEFAAKNVDKITELKKRLVLLKERDAWYKKEKGMNPETLSGGGAKTEEFDPSNFVKIGNDWYNK